MVKKVEKPEVESRPLLPIFDRMNDSYFGGLVVAGIGYRVLPIDPENVILGNCLHSERFIRINNILKDKEVPLMFLEYVVFHEMCHLVYHPGAAGEDGHEDVDHNPRFQSLEKRYPYYRQAIEFDSTELPAIVEKWRNYRESKNK